VDIHHTLQGSIAEERAKSVFKRRIPIQNVVLKTVNRIQDNVLVPVTEFPPSGTILILRTVDDVADFVSDNEKRGEHLPRSHKNPCTKPCGGLLEIDGSVHSFLLFPFA
jgi:hypothetical protein